MTEVTHLPDHTIANPALPPPDEELPVDVPKRTEHLAARRPWFEDRWRAFHFETADTAAGVRRMHHQLRRRRI